MAFQIPKKRTTVFIGNLNYDITTDQLQAAFQNCGNILEIKIATHPDTGRSKGFGYIEFEDENGAKSAIELSGTEIANRKIRVDPTKK